MANQTLIISSKPLHEQHHWARPLSIVAHADHFALSVGGTDTLSASHLADLYVENDLYVVRNSCFNADGRFVTWSTVAQDCYMGALSTFLVKTDEWNRPPTNFRRLTEESATEFIQMVGWAARKTVITMHGFNTPIELRPDCTSYELDTTIFERNLHRCMLDAYVVRTLKDAREQGYSLSGCDALRVSSEIWLNVEQPETWSLDVARKRCLTSSPTNRPSAATPFVEYTPPPVAATSPEVAACTRVVGAMCDAAASNGEDKQAVVQRLDAIIKSLTTLRDDIVAKGEAA